MKRIPVTRIVLGLLCLMYFITYIDRVNVSTAADGFSKEFGLNKTQIGLVFSAFAYPYLLFQIIGGWISDRLGARRTLIACGTIWAAATVLTGENLSALYGLAVKVMPIEGGGLRAFAAGPSPSAHSA